jgi:hypothetical protein
MPIASLKDYKSEDGDGDDHGGGGGGGSGERIDGEKMSKLGPVLTSVGSWS